MVDVKIIYDGDDKINVRCGHDNCRLFDVDYITKNIEIMCRKKDVNGIKHIVKIPLDVILPQIPKRGEG